MATVVLVQFLKLYLLNPFHSLGCLLMLLEPSCGHGDIIKELVRQLDESNVSPESISIRGYDIDPNATQTCQQTLPFSKYQTVYTCQINGQV
jgi:hypothetical protein